MTGTLLLRNDRTTAVLFEFQPLLFVSPSHLDLTPILFFLSLLSGFLLCRFEPNL